MSDALPETMEERATPAHPDFLAYDYFKTLTSLSVLTLGGILTLTETVFGRQFETWHIIAVSSPIAAAGVVALQCQTDIVQIAKGHRPGLPLLKIGLRLAPALYGLGLGAFLVVLFEALAL